MKLKTFSNRIKTAAEAAEIAATYSEESLDFEAGKPFFIVNDAPLGVRISQYKTKKSAAAAIENLRAKGYKNIFMVEC